MKRAVSAFYRRTPRLALLMLAGASLAACATTTPRVAGPDSTSNAPPESAFLDRDGKPLRGTMKPYQLRGLWYYPREQPYYNVIGIGSWYGEAFHNRQTSNGEIFDMDLISAAHKTLPLPSLVEVTNLENGRRITIRVNDRGPFVGDRVIDLSRAAAEQLGYRQKGVANVRVRYIGPAPGSSATRQQSAFAPPQPARSPAQKFRVRRVVTGAPAGYRVQAGTFSDHNSAQSAVDRLRTAGPTLIEQVDQDGVILYRVVIGPVPDEPIAWALRDQVAALGWRDAVILRP